MEENRRAAPEPDDRAEHSHQSAGRLRHDQYEPDRIPVPGTTQRVGEHLHRQRLLSLRICSTTTFCRYPPNRLFGSIIIADIFFLTFPCSLKRIWIICRTCLSILTGWQVWLPERSRFRAEREVSMGSPFLGAAAPGQTPGAAAESRASAVFVRSIGFPIM